MVGGHGTSIDTENIEHNIKSNVKGKSMGIQVVAHTSFLGHTGYNNHSKNFFTNLNKYIPTRVHNYSYTPDLSYLKPEEYNLIIEQRMDGHKGVVGKPFIPNPQDTTVNLVLNESHHYYFYDQYAHPMIAYNVWESTKQLPEFFDRILEYDQFWCPTEWQRKCTIEQGYPEDRVKVVPEGVNGKLFCPGVSSRDKDLLYEEYDIPGDAFVFMIFGRWDYRKATLEMIQSWREQFKDRDNCYLVLSVDNPFSSDEMDTTEERLKHYGVEHERIRILHFVSRNEYVKWMQYGACLLSCSRSEGWNLPLMEAIACGTPTICSNWGGHLEFADGIAHKVQVLKELPPKQVYMLGDDCDLGVWGEPDFGHLKHVMEIKVYKDYMEAKTRAMAVSKYIRELYTWDNAARKAEGYISELVTNKYHSIKVDPNREKVKINLGCGNDIRKGYINVDKYNNTGLVDYQWDLAKLEVEDGSVDEIFTAHVFEHIPFNEVYGVLEEWHRALRLGGEIVIYLPNLEAEAKMWLDAPDDKKWFELHRIYGGQTHEGNFHFNGHTQGSLKWLVERFGFKVTSVGLGNRGFMDEIQLTAQKVAKIPTSKPNFVTHFVEGPFGEITGDLNDTSFYVIDFLDPDNNASVHQQPLGINNWTRPHRKYYTNWDVKIHRNGKLVHEHKFDVTGKNILISFDSKSMGDTIAWMPYTKEFKEKHNCTVFVSTFWNNLFEGAEEYKDLKFVPPGKVVNNLYASYSIGCFDDDYHKNKTNWRLIPLQQVASEFLGLEYEEILTSIGIDIGKRPMKDKYVTLSEFSTFQCKHWNYPGGWQTIVEFIEEELGYKVAVISKEKSNLKGVINWTDRPIKRTIGNIAHAEFHMGVSAGPTWLAWALNVPTVMISGFSKPFGEFSTNCQRVINTDVCHGCFNDLSKPFDRGNWNWCPHNTGTDREFECTKTITPRMVIDAILNI